MTGSPTVSSLPTSLTPLRINQVEFKNRILRSSVGGRTCNYDGTVTDVWKNFEKRFAEGGVGGIISTTFHVNRDRLSPPQYPSIADDKYLPYIKKYIAQIKVRDCKYIVQIGDPGYTTYSSLFSDERDALSASPGFDPAFGYNNRRHAMLEDAIERSIAEFVAAAVRVQRSGADGLEVTATKGYLIHQFLNPGINRRDDAWGGDADRRFRFLERIVKGIRNAVGREFLFGIRLSAEDFNDEPGLLTFLRWPLLYTLGPDRKGNRLPQMLSYGQRLEALGVDYLHIVAGYGFPNPRDVPGKFPFDEIRMFFDSVRHLSGKAAARAVASHVFPDALSRWASNIGWHAGEAVNLDYAARFKNAVQIPVIANGGFEARDAIEAALQGRCDMVSMARSLIANPDLIDETWIRRGQNLPERRCSQCNRCVGRTTTSPLGCYEPNRFDSQEEMFEQILKWNQPDQIVELDWSQEEDAKATVRFDKIRQTL